VEEVAFGEGKLLDILRSIIIECLDDLARDVSVSYLKNLFSG